jgi:hypothetical protein
MNLDPSIGSWTHPGYMLGPGLLNKAIKTGKNAIVANTINNVVKDGAK